MEIKFSRHARRQMKWRKIAQGEIEMAINSPEAGGHEKGKEECFQNNPRQTVKDNLQA